MGGGDVHVVPFQFDVYDYARHHPDAGESSHRSEGAAAVESGHLVPTLRHETPLEGAVGHLFEDPLRLDALPPRGNRRTRDELVHFRSLRLSISRFAAAVHSEASGEARASWMVLGTSGWGVPTA